MASSIKAALDGKMSGFHIGNRIILPFRCQFIKLIVSKHIYHEFSGNKDIKISQDPKNTSVYFTTVGDLDNYIGTYKIIKAIVAEWDADLTDVSNHKKLIFEPNEEHILDIYLPNDDMIFIE